MLSTSLAREKRTMAKLKRCPFCDGEPVVRHANFPWMASVACPDCGAEIKVIDEDVKKVVTEAIEKWNRRKGK